MNDLELKDLLLSTHQIGPGQESRAWALLQERISSPRWPWLFYISWRSFGYTALALLAAAAIFDLGASLGMKMRPSEHGLAFADSQVPGIYATSFYSHSAQAQVVWLNGLDPATDKPTYLDPTSAIVNHPKPTPPHTPNRSDSL